MLEFIIKQNDNEIGRFQFDPNWHTFDVVMNMLGGYVVREFVPNGKMPEGSPEQAKQINVSKGLLSPMTGHMEVKTLPTPNGNRNPTPSPPTEEHGLLDREYVVLSKRAAGRRHALKFRGKVINGNMVAGLVALHKRGAPIDEPRDLLTALRRDFRFETANEKSTVGTIRNFLSNLITVELVEKQEDGSYVITELGSKVAHLMDIPLEPKLRMSASDSDAQES